MLSFAPLYDSGSSLGFNKLEKEIAKGSLVECKPFKKKHEEQLELVSSFSWLDLAALDSLEEEAREVFGLDKEGDYLSFSRIEAICLALRERVKRLKEFIAKRGE